jgi:hypothetical protein
MGIVPLPAKPLAPAGWGLAGPEPAHPLEERILLALGAPAANLHHDRRLQKLPTGIACWHCLLPIAYCLYCLYCLYCPLPMLSIEPAACCLLSIVYCLLPACCKSAPRKYI